MDACRRQPRVLIVDSNRDHSVGLSLLLKVSGCEVEIAHGGTEAIAAAKACPPDLAILEMNLPDLDGFRVAEQLRTEFGPENISIVALTGYSLEMLTGRSPRSLYRQACGF
jgi:CheY-like chemotaxis protein